MSLSDNSKAFNVAEACARLGGISRKTFYELANAGELKTFEIGSRRYVSAESIYDFIKRKESTSSTPEEKYAARKAAKEAAA